MKTTVIPLVKKALFYVPFLAGGAIIAHQFPGISEHIAGLEQRVAENLDYIPYVSRGIADLAVNSAEFALGAATAIATGETIKKSRKKRDFKELKVHDGIEKPQQEQHSLARKAGFYFGKLGVKTGLAVASATSLLASGVGLEELYNSAAVRVNELVASSGPVLETLLDNPAAKIAAGITAIAAGSKLYSLTTGRKHGPIVKRYNINGYIGPVRKLHPRRLQARRWGVGWESLATQGLSSETVPYGKITSHDWRDGSKRIMLLNYRQDLEPHKARRPISEETVRGVINYLGDFALRSANERKVLIPSSQVPNLARNSKIYENFKIGGEESGFDRADVVRVVRALSNAGCDNILNMDIDRLTRKLGKEKVWGGGFFHALVYDPGKPPSLRLSIKCNPQHTDAASRDKVVGYGNTYLDRGKLLMVLEYRTFESGSVKGDGLIEESVADGAIGSNVVREIKKGWNTILFDKGLGRNFSIHFGGEAYTFDEWWAGSFQFLNFIPGLRGKDYALRRIGHVYNSHGEIVAKVEDKPRRVLSKLWGNYDLTVDIYDARLASNENFGALLCGFSRFFINQGMYRKHQRQEIQLKRSFSIGAGDQQVGNV